MREVKVFGIVTIAAGLFFTPIAGAFGLFLILCGVITLAVASAFD